MESSLLPWCFFLFFLPWQLSTFFISLLISCSKVFKGKLCCRLSQRTAVKGNQKDPIHSIDLKMRHKIQLVHTLSVAHRLSRTAPEALRWWESHQKNKPWIPQRRACHHLPQKGKKWFDDYNLKEDTAKHLHFTHRYCKQNDKWIRLPN